MKHLNRTILPLLLSLLMILGLFTGCIVNKVRSGISEAADSVKATADSLMQKAEDAIKDTFTINIKLNLFPIKGSRSYMLEGVVNNRGSKLCFDLHTTEEAREMIARLIRTPDGTFYCKGIASEIYSAIQPKDGELISVELDFLPSLPWTVNEEGENYELTYTVSAEAAADVLGKLLTLGDSLEAVGLGDLTGVTFHLTLDKKTCRPLNFDVTWPELTQDKLKEIGARLLRSASLSVNFDEYGCDAQISAPEQIRMESFSAFAEQWILTANSSMNHQEMSYIFPVDKVNEVLAKAEDNADQNNQINENSTEEHSENAEDWLQDLENPTD